MGHKSIPLKSVSSKGWFMVAIVTGRKLNMMD